VSAEPRVVAPDMGGLTVSDAARLERIEQKLDRVLELAASLATPENLALLERASAPMRWKLARRAMTTPDLSPGGSNGV